MSNLIDKFIFVFVNILFLYFIFNLIFSDLDSLDFCVTLTIIIGSGYLLYDIYKTDNPFGRNE